jgi:hypothetical protein
VHDDPGDGGLVRVGLACGCAQTRPLLIGEVRPTLLADQLGYEPPDQLHLSQVRFRGAGHLGSLVGHHPGVV